MKRKTQLAAWGAVTAISFAISTAAPARAADQTSSSDTAPGFKQAATTGSSQSEKSFGQLERANKLIGKAVLTSDNQKFGKIDDFVMEVESGRILYAVVGSGGVLGAGEKRFAVAPGAFTDTQGNNVHVSVDKQKLNEAPQFTRDIDKDSELAKVDFVSKVYQHFGQNAWWQSGTASASEGTFHNVHKAKDLIGAKIQNVNNEPIGKLDNIMADLPAGRIAYFILAPDSSLALGNNLYALPPMLTPGPDSKTFTADLTKDKLAGAPHFEKNNWQNLSDPSFASQVYQYYGKQAYFSTGAGSALQPTGRSDSSKKPQ